MPIDPILPDAEVEQLLPLCGQILAVGRAAGISDLLPVHRAIVRLPVVLDLMRAELAALPAGFLDPQESTELVETAMEVFRDGTATLRVAVERDGADLEPPEPYGRLKPLVEFREAFAATLDATADALRKGGKQLGNDD